MKVGFVSLGCAKNLVDTEVMLGIMQRHGLELTVNPSDADILIVNTCAFIASAKEESITTILNLAEYKSEGNCRSLIIAGCLGQRYRQELLDEMPEADAIIGTNAWHRIMEAIEETLKGRRVILIGDKEIIYDAKTPRIRTTPDYMAYVKIAEGCDHHCAFCAIPLIRGRQISRPMEDIRAEVERLVADGVKEINLIAQDSTNYGRDLYGAPSLARLLRELVKIDGLDLDLQVDAIEQRTRNLAHVMRALVLVADAFLLWMAIIPAWARIHRGHEHERGGVFGRVFRPTDAYNPVLQRLPHHLQHASIKFWQLIQAERLAPFPCIPIALTPLKQASFVP